MEERLAEGRGSKLARRCWEEGEDWERERLSEWKRERQSFEEREEVGAMERGREEGWYDFGKLEEKDRNG